MISEKAVYQKGNFILEGGNQVKKKGFTLIEVIITMAITVIVFTIINNIFISSNKILTRVDSKSYLQDMSRSVLQYIGDDIKRAEDITLEVKIDGTDLVIDGRAFALEDGTPYALPIDLLNPLMVVDIDSKRYLYGLFNVEGKKGLKRINLNDENDSKVFSGEIEVLEIENLSKRVGGTLSDVYSITLTMMYKGQSKSYNTATFIIKEDGNIR